MLHLPLGLASDSDLGDETLTEALLGFQLTLVERRRGRGRLSSSEEESKITINNSIGAKRSSINSSVGDVIQF